MKHEKIIDQMTLGEKCFLLSGKDFWQTRSVERLDIPSMIDHIFHDLLPAQGMAERPSTASAPTRADHSALS